MTEKGLPAALDGPYPVQSSVGISSSTPAEDLGVGGNVGNGGPLLDEGGLPLPMEDN